MKGRSIVPAALPIVALLWLAGSAALAFAGPSNGSFEIGTHSSGSFDALAAGNTNLTDWSIDSGSIDWIGSYWQAADGSRSLDLNGVEPGTISQTLATTVDNTYTVTFFLSGNPAGGPLAKTLTVAASGADPASYTFDVGIAGNTFTDMKWAAQEYSFVATSASTVLTFTSTTAGIFGPALDNVDVTESVAPSPSVPPSESAAPSESVAPSESAVPSESAAPSESATPSESAAPSEPIASSGPVTPTKEDCKNDGWRTMLDARGDGFKNQGDCVSYFATDGRNLGALAR